MKPLFLILTLEICSTPFMQAGSQMRNDQNVGAKLWEENCQSCHNRPRPSAYSNTQWDVLIQHMRVRAKLTGNEAREVLDFIKDSK